MATWYDLDIHESTCAIYVDSHTAESWGNDIDPDSLLSSYRRRYFLPSSGSCEVKPVVFIIDHFNRFLVCFMDFSREALHILAENPDLESWDSWDGPNYYRHICQLHGWTCGDISRVKVITVQSKLRNLAHCSAMGLALVERVLKRGLKLDKRGRLRVSSSLGCQHLIRKKTFEYVLRILLNSYRCYGVLYPKPPPEWAFWGEQDIYEAIPAERAKKYADLERDEDVETMKQLHHVIALCDDCQITISATAGARTTPHNSLFRGGQDRSGGHDAPDEQSNEASDDSNSDNFNLGKFQRYLSKRRQTYPNQKLPKLGRFDRPMLPPKLPPPRPPLFPPHQPTFDDYSNGPTRDALLPYPDEYNLPEFSMVDRHQTFVDYGYRLLSRFAHAFHCASPVMLPDHIFPIGTSPNYTPGSCMAQDVPLLSRTFTGADQKGTMNDFIEMGAVEMLQAAGQIDSRNSQEVFVRGRNPSDGKLIRVNLERDHATLNLHDVKISAEVDSFIFIGQLIRVLKSVKVYVTACISRDPPISRDNHVRVELLLPLSTEERLEYGDNRPSFQEKGFRLSQIPHMRFADLGEGINVYIFFPRATHKKPNTPFKDATISYLDQWFFLEHVVLPALHQHVPSTDMARYGYDADGFNMKTATQTRMKGNKGIPKGLAVKPDAFHGMQNTMRILVKADQDGSLAPYDSFFFVMEGKGIGLGVVVEDMSVVPATQPLDNLFNHFEKIDFPFMMDRANGESYFDVAFCVNPTSSHTGLGRLDSLEASFGAAGFLTGKQFPWNTMGYFGSMQAEMEQKRSQQTHILHRSWYMSFYNLSRNFENRPWAPPDEDGYHFTSRFGEVWNSRISEYLKGAGRQNAYGVRDEYRIGGQALPEFLNNALEKVQIPSFLFQPQKIRLLFV